MSVLAHPRFRDEPAAYEWLEALLWPDGPVCPHCGATDRVYVLKGKAHRIGVKKCGHCRKQFTVKVGTVFESSHVPLHKWLQAVHLLCCSKKGVSSHQLHRLLGVTYKTAWFMAHRLREAMRAGSLGPLGGEGRLVEADETYFGNNDVVTKRTIRGKAGLASKRAVVGLVERGGSLRAFHVARANKPHVAAVVRENVAREATLVTDESRLYHEVGKEFAGHARVNHSLGQYVQGEAHTNTLEGFFSVFKRGMRGVYQHCREKHLHRYLAEFEFRHNNRAGAGVGDGERAERALAGTVGKRLTYRQSAGRA